LFQPKTRKCSKCETIVFDARNKNHPFNFIRLEFNQNIVRVDTRNPDFPKFDKSFCSSDFFSVHQCQTKRKEMKEEAIVSAQAHKLDEALRKTLAY
jgi:hypothetical protein